MIGIWKVCKLKSVTCDAEAKHILRKNGLLP